MIVIYKIRGTLKEHNMLAFLIVGHWMKETFQNEMDYQPMALIKVREFDLVLHLSFTQELLLLHDSIFVQCLSNPF